MEKLAEQYDGKAVVAKVDVDEQRELAIQYRVMSVPTVIFLKDGKEVDRKIGVREPAAVGMLKVKVKTPSPCR